MPLSKEVLEKAMTQASNSGRKFDYSQDGGKRFGDGKKDFLPLTFVGGACEFTGRVVLDKNKVLCRTYMMYQELIPNSEGGKDKVKYVVEGVQKKRRDGVVYTDYREKDPIWEWAQKLNEKLNTWTYRPRLAVAYYGDIVSIANGTSKYLKTGPGLIIFNGETFKEAFEVACNTLKESRDPMGKEIGLELLLHTLDATSKGLLMKVSYTPGKQAKCMVAFDTIGQLQHEFAPDVAEKFQDITMEYAPQLGTNNDANGIKIIEFYKRELESVTHYAKPDKVEEAPPLVPAQGSAAKSPAKKKPAPPPDEDDELDAVIKAMGDA